MRAPEEVRRAPEPGKNNTVWNGGSAFLGRSRYASTRSSPYDALKLTFSSRQCSALSSVDSIRSSSSFGSYE